MKPLQMTTLTLSVCLIVVSTLQARPRNEIHEYTNDRHEVDRVGMVGDDLRSAKASFDTLWIAEWDFDAGIGVCDPSGWTTFDRRNPATILGTETHWQVRGDFTGIGGIVGQAGIIGAHDLCWSYPDGYDNNWYQALEIPYLGVSYLSFDYLLDSEEGFDFIQVEVDSACASRSLDLTTNMESSNYWGDAFTGSGAQFRTLLWSASGFDTTGSLDSLLLEDFGAVSDTHCVYIAFFADGAYAPSDGLQPTTLGVAVVLDNLELTGNLPLQEDFEGVLDARITPRSMWVDRNFGDWARLFPHVTDNDVCTENATCAWLWTDDQTPTYANDPIHAFGPNGYVVRAWLDNSIISPWVSLTADPGLVGTIISFRRFGGSFFSLTKRLQNWAVRGRTVIDNTDTPAPGDSIECISTWGHATQHNSLNSYEWVTNYWRMENNFDPASTQIQLRIKTEDWQFIAGAAPPSIFKPAPGPYVDYVRIGRLLQTGPSFDPGLDMRYQAQDAFPTQPLAGTTGGVEPTTDRFGTTAFSRSCDLALFNSSSRLVTGDSITVEVVDLVDAGGVVSVNWFGAIVAGPHAGKAPPPYNVQANGFFFMAAQQCRNAQGVIVADRYFVDLDDEYFRGGDVLYYYWQATDAGGDVSYLPDGIIGTPTDVAEAELWSGGLFEVSFLPSINWDAGYLGRIAADAHGKLEPTQQEVAGSEQATCLLYSQIVNTDRRSGESNRTSFMYTLDQLGYRGHYDVYDHQGSGNINNHLGGRATVQQAEGYALIVHDAGSAAPGAPIMPDGLDLGSEKIDMLGWYAQYLAAGLNGESGSASVWIIGENGAEEKPIGFFQNSMNTMLQLPAQSANVNPSVVGQVASYAFASGATADFTTDSFRMLGGCPLLRGYDALAATGTGVVTHQYEDDSSVGGGAVVMSSDAATQTNTVVMSLVWSDVMHAASGPGSPTQDLAQKILSGVLPPGCVGTPTDVPDADPRIATPARSVLYQNQPNPFNPTTRIVFDLQRQAHVTLRIYDVAGRLVRTLLNETRPAGFAHSVNWDGLDEAGRRVPSGVYFYRVNAADFGSTRKLVVMK